MSGRPWLLALDTATSVVVVAAGTPDGDLLAAETFAAGHRHGSHLLPTITRLLADCDLALPDLAGVIVGLGPGAFTGLRVGLATAKTLAHDLGLPIVGLSTGEALLSGAAEPPDGVPRGATSAGLAELFLPAGPHDRVRLRAGSTPALEAGAMGGEPKAESASAVAVDLEGRASEAALARGRRALDALPATLIRLGAARLAAGAVDDVERLVPEYVSLPRGVTSDLGDGGVSWSRDPR